MVKKKSQNKLYLKFLKIGEHDFYLLLTVSIRSEFKITMKNHCDGDVFEHTKPETMLK